MTKITITQEEQDKRIELHNQNKCPICKSADRSFAEERHSGSNYRSEWTCNECGAYYAVSHEATFIWQTRYEQACLNDGEVVAVDLRSLNPGKSW
jgi:transposase-like protein